MFKPKYKVIDIDKYGPSWFVVSKTNANAKRVTVKTSEDLYASFEKANNGDTILIDADVLKLNKTIKVNKSVVHCQRIPVTMLTVSETDQGNAAYSQHLQYH